MPGEAVGSEASAETQVSIWAQRSIEVGVGDCDYGEHTKGPAVMARCRQEVAGIELTVTYHSTGFHTLTSVNVEANPLDCDKLLRLLLAAWGRPYINSTPANLVDQGYLPVTPVWRENVAGSYVSAVLVSRTSPAECTVFVTHHGFVEQIRERVRQSPGVKDEERRIRAAAEDL